MRHRARSDDNQQALIDAARQIGAYVFDVHRLGTGFVDLVVAHQGKTYLVEVKNGQGRLTPAEQKFHYQMAEAGVETYVWRDVSDVVRDLRAT